MRTAMLWLIVVLALATPASLDARAAEESSASAVALTEGSQQPPDYQVDINVDRGGAWYTSPLWLAIGGLALLLVILLVVMAVRGGGGGTTVIRD